MVNDLTLEQTVKELGWLKDQYHRHTAQWAALDYAETILRTLGGFYAPARPDTPQGPGEPQAYALGAEEKRSQTPQGTTAASQKGIVQVLQETNR